MWLSSCSTLPVEIMWQVTEMWQVFVIVWYWLAVLFPSRMWLRRTSSQSWQSSILRWLMSCSYKAGQTRRCSFTTRSSSSSESVLPSSVWLVYRQRYTCRVLCLYGDIIRHSTNILDTQAFLKASVHNHCESRINTPLLSLCGQWH